MLQIALREKLPIYTETPVRDFVVENGRVTGVIAVRGGREVRIQARDGVLINAGGFSRSREMRERFQPKPNPWQWTNANPGDTGEMIEAAMRLGAAIDCMNESWWVITSLGPDESLPEGAVNPEGVAIPFMHHLDLSLPHLIMVDQDGPPFLRRIGRLHGDRPAPLREARGDRQGRAGLGDPRSPPSGKLSVGHRPARQDTAVLARQRLHEAGRHARGTRSRLAASTGRVSRPKSRNSTGIAAPASTPSSIAADARSIAHTVTRRSRQTRTSGRSSRARSTRSRCIPATSARPAASSPTSTPGFCARTHLSSKGCTRRATRPHPWWDVAIRAPGRASAPRSCSDILRLNTPRSQQGRLARTPAGRQQHEFSSVKGNTGRPVSPHDARSSRTTSASVPRSRPARSLRRITRRAGRK